MRKWNEAGYDIPKEHFRVEVREDHRKQDDDFCRALRAALYAGTESCPVGVSNEPGTKKPILNYHRPD